jgi:hypothetical protein
MYCLVQVAKNSPAAAVGQQSRAAFTQDQCSPCFMLHEMLGTVDGGPRLSCFVQQSSQDYQ